MFLDMGLNWLAPARPFIRILDGSVIAYRKKDSL
jgi:hypothetical protein